MKYKCGNTYKEALGRAAVEVTSLEQYNDYAKRYAVMIPVTVEETPVPPTTRKGRK